MSDHAQDHDHGEHHALPLWLLIGTWVALMGLTAATVGQAQLELGAFEMFATMGIATIKAMLVMLIFMHLAWDKGFHSMLIFGSFLFVWLFISFLMIDRGQYQTAIDYKEQETIRAAD